MPKSASSKPPVQKVESVAAQHTAGSSGLSTAEQRFSAPEEQQQLQATIAASPQVQAAAQFQAKVSQHMAAAMPPAPVQRKAAPANGLPAPLKSGVEQLSGISLDHVRVHYNSPRPAQLQAHAYAQGSDIHLAPGQEKHLPHEAWHVVQQAQGRVKPTLQMKSGVPVNDDQGLEREADRMGARALQVRAQAHAPGALRQPEEADVVQRIAVQIAFKEKKPPKEEKQVTTDSHTLSLDMDTKDDTPTTALDEKEEIEEVKPMIIEEKGSVPNIIIENNVNNPFANNDLFSNAVISRVSIVGRPEKLFSGSMGDHTTAFAVHQKGIILGLTGKSPREGLDYMKSLIADAKLLPGMSEALLEKSGRKEKIKALLLEAKHYRNLGLKALDKHSVRFTQYFQRLVATYLEFRELIPLSALNISAISFGLAGKGKAEAKYVNQLVDFESDKEKLSQEEIQNNILSLLDTKGLILAITEPDLRTAEAVVPGIQGDTDRLSLFKDVVKQHLLSIKAAFPLAYEKANITDLDKVVAHILFLHKDEIQNRIADNQKDNLAGRKNANELINKYQKDTITDIHEINDENLLEDKGKQAKLIKLLDIIDLKIKDLNNRHDKLTPQQYRTQYSKILFDLSPEDKSIPQSHEITKRLMKHIYAIKGQNHRKRLLYAAKKFLKNLDESTALLKLPEEVNIPSEGIDTPNKEAPSEKQAKRTNWIGSEELSKSQQEDLDQKIASNKKIVEEDNEVTEEPKQENPEHDDIKDENELSEHEKIQRKKLLKKMAKEKEEKELENEEKRLPIATEITLDKKLRIVSITSSGRTKSPFKGSMGAHTTAWVVHVDEIRTQLKGKTVKAAIAQMHHLVREAYDKYNVMEKLFNMETAPKGNQDESSSMDIVPKFDPLSPMTISLGHQAQLITARKNLARFANLEDKPKLMLLPGLQSYINALLDFINLIPGSTLNKTNTTGRGEGTSRQYLQKFEDDDNLDVFKVADHVDNLLDVSKLQEFGLSEAAIKQIKANHLISVGKAYPEAMKHYNKKRNTRDFQRRGQGNFKKRKTKKQDDDSDEDS